MAVTRYDTIIIGGGPAGITAGIYATRSGLKTLIIESMVVGGQSALTYEIDNYPGFTKISGMELGSKFAEHAESLGVEFVFDTIKSMSLEGEEKIFETVYSGSFSAPSVIICVGAKPRTLGLDNEEKFIGRGISFCATCDGAFYKDKTVAVVGGGNSALEEALFLSKNCAKVYLLHMLDNFQANDSMVEKMKAEPKIEYYLNTRVLNVDGDTNLKKIHVQDSEADTERDIDVDGMFIAIGRVPATDMFKEVVEMDKYGYIIADEDLRTNVEGVFVAGDARQKKVRQIITACSDGAIAAVSANSYLIEKNLKTK